MSKTISHKEEWVSLIGEGGQNYWVNKHKHPVFDAASVMVSGGSVLFSGPSGSGKSSASAVLCNPKNYPILLHDTAYEAIHVCVRHVPIDMTKVITAQELYATTTLQNGNTRVEPGVLGSFIADHGYPTQEELMAFEADRTRVLRSGKGEVIIYAIIFDDLDRVVDSQTVNVTLKPTNDSEHVLPHDNCTRYLRCQAVATSNSTCARQNKYSGAAGLDPAQANRFTMFLVPHNPVSKILVKEYQSIGASTAQLETIEKFGLLIEEVSKEINTHGAFPDLGEVSIRQAKSIVKCYLYAKFDAERAVDLLFAGLANEEDQEKAEVMKQRYFGNGPTKKRTGILF